MSDTKPLLRSWLKQQGLGSGLGLLLLALLVGVNAAAIWGILASAAAAEAEAIEELRHQTTMQARGLDPALCARIVRMVEIAEFKRRQAPIVLRISKQAFGAGRRIPVAKKL